MYEGHTVHQCLTREKALIYAHDYLKDQYIVEYGVIELDPMPDKPCGRCYVCVHERKIISDDLPRCDGCGKPISSSEWQVYTQNKIYHYSCEPRMGAV
jgi:hypothetical protein